MRLKKIILDNIRSYEHQEIEFPEGSILLSGDIGSGKTSVLLGIEFALFGLQPGQRGSSLLRNGENQGGVKIEFEVDGKEVIVERNLKRAKAISQDACSIIIDGDKKEFSVTELKNKILELLNYPKEFSKKQNILYKFTVYTPQEEMKQIILQDPATRINTLRHVFGIDKYKTILENISILVSKIREEKRIKEGLTLNLEQDKANLILKENELQLKSSNLILVEEELFAKTINREKIQKEKQEIFEKTKEKNQLKQEIEKTKIMIANKKESVFGNTKLLEQFEIQISELIDLKFDEAKVSELENQVVLSKSEKQKLEEFVLDKSSQISSINLRNKEDESLDKKIHNLEICPTCLQNVDAVYRANVLNKLHVNISENNKKLQELEKDKKQILEKIEIVNSKISLTENQIQELKILKLKCQGIQEKQLRVNEIEQSNTFLERDIQMLDKHLENLNQHVFELNKFDNLLESKQKELETALEQEKNIEIKVAELKKEIYFFSVQIKESKEKIKTTEETREQFDYLSKLEDWLSKKFASVISAIEQNVMIKLKAEFSQLFAEWFYMLVSDSFNVRLSEDFTPIIEQQDYELDYAYLSGGERTAIALAYRLSLTQVINSLLSEIKTKDIVILDEPTDGFSDQQLDKMRDVLQQLNIKQMIIVSHEQKIEGFVENVLKFKKVNGISVME